MRSSKKKVKKPQQTFDSIDLGSMLSTHNQNIDIEKNFREMNERRNNALEIMGANQSVCDAYESMIKVQRSDGSVSVGDSVGGLKSNLYPQRLPSLVASWFTSQTFIGYQMCYYIGKAPMFANANSRKANATVKDGFTFDVSQPPVFKNGLPVFDELETEESEAIIRYLEYRFRKDRVQQQMVEALFFNEMYGIRLMKIDYGDDVDYTVPFTWDAVKGKKFLGLTQIDPYWVVPNLDGSNMNPSDKAYFEPQYWQVAGDTLHRSWINIIRTFPVADVLKPEYFFGGVPTSELIYQRLYSSERTANEVPLLAMTKRMYTQKIDIQKAIANPSAFQSAQTWAAQNQTNYSTKFIGTNEEVDKFETALSDINEVMMGQYQLCAAILEMPITHFLSNSPAGFNTGDLEIQAYNEVLDSSRKNRLSPMLQLWARNIIFSEMGLELDVEINWNPIDTPSEVELSTIRMNSSTYLTNMINTSLFSDAELRKTAENIEVLDLNLDPTLEADNELQDYTGNEDDENNPNEVLTKSDGGDE